MNLLRHIQSQLKIVIRYLDLLVGGTFFFIGAGILLVILSRSYHINIPLFFVVLTVFSTGGLFGNLFCEKQSEIQGYMLTPWSLRQVILSKNIAIIVLTAVFILPILVAVLFFIPIVVQDYIDIALYIITSISVCLLLGNIVSVSKNVMLSAQKGVSPLQWIIIVSSPIPYLIFKSWMQSWSLCLSFFFISLFVWYFYEIPWVERKFQTAFYKIR